MSWDNETVVKLINAYQTKEVLWNPINPNYYNRILKKDAWDELETELQRPVEELKKKMDTLLSGLRREKQKIMKSKTTGKGTDEVYQPSWFAYPHLMFLFDRNKPRERLNTEDLGVEDELSQTTEKSPTPTPGSPPPTPDSQASGSHGSQAPRSPAPESQGPERQALGSPASGNQVPESRASETDTPESQAPRNQVSGSHAALSSKFKPPVPIKKFKKSAPQKDTILNEALQLMKSSAQVAASATCATSSPALTNDSYQIYANYLASKFRAYTQRTFITVEHHINNILYYADSGHYELQRGHESPYSRTPTPETPSPIQNITANYEHAASAGVCGQQMCQAAYSRTPTPEVPSPSQNETNSEHSASTGVYEANSMDADDFSDLIKFT